MLKLSKQVIYNKIEQCLVSIPSDICCRGAYAVNDVVNWMWDFRANENSGKSVVVTRQPMGRLESVLGKC